jgi:hypothetical protein
MKKLLFLFIAIASFSISAATPSRYSQRCIKISQEAILLAKIGMSRKPGAILQVANKTKSDHQDLTKAREIVKAQRSHFQQLLRHFCGKENNLRTEEVTAFIAKYEAEQWSEKAIAESLGRKIARMNIAIACFDNVLRTDITAVVKVANQHLLGQ